jgi:predicted DNA-binding transcriptional regulator YafY
MSKRESISRYNIIIKLLKKRSCTFEEISTHLQQESEIQSYNFSISKRTFQRDLADIRTIYNIDIKFDFVKKVYYMDFDQNPEFNERLFEAFDIFNALNISESLSDFIHLEKRNPQGTENLSGLLNAIRNRMQISFVHLKFWDDKPTIRTLNPYVLKEFRNRWYVMGLDVSDKQIKSFALDRLSSLHIFSNNKFNKPKDFDTQQHFKSCFGIISPNKKKPDQIILSFTPLQGKYIKTLPLHESQEIILDTPTELQIKLNVFITHDLLMEIFSFGDSVKIIEPKHLVDEITATYKSALKQYKK